MSRRGRVWTPLEVDQHVESIKKSLDKLSDPKYGYREAVLYVRGDRQDSRRTDENRGLRVSTSEVSDPTSAIVVSQEWNRNRLIQAIRLLESAAKDIDTAVSRIRDVFDGPYEPLEGYRS